MLLNHGVNELVHLTGQPLGDRLHTKGQLVQESTGLDQRRDVAKRMNLWVIAQVFANV